jgi:hypothetical protein
LLGAGAAAVFPEPGVVGVVLGAGMGAGVGVPRGAVAAGGGGDMTIVASLRSFGPVADPAAGGLADVAAGGVAAAACAAGFFGTPGSGARPF